MRILITGGAGFIGSHLAERLIRRGDQVVIVDNFSTGLRSNVPVDAQVIELDLAKPDFPSHLPPDPFDAVCHLAAQSSGEISGENPLYDQQANAASTLLLSRWCLQKGIKRFLYASSMAVYGNPARFPVKETDRCVPLSYYGISKLTSEHILRLAEREGLKSTSFRMFSVYGPGQNLQNLKQGMVSIYLAYLLKGVEVPVTGSLDRFRDFVYIDDVIDAWMLALRKVSTPSLVYNLGSGRPCTVRKLLQILLKAFHKPAHYPIRKQKGSAADQFGLYASIRLAKNDLRWGPKTTLNNGIQSMANWALSLSTGAALKERVAT